ATTHDFKLLVIIAFFGTINPAVGNASIFIPMEHAILTRLSVPRERTRSFAHYSFYGAMAAAIGALAISGSDVFMKIGLSQVAAAELLFIVYGLLGALVGFLYYLISVEENQCTPQNLVGLGPSRSIVHRLAFLFSIDALAGGLAVQSLLFLWLYQRFGLSLQTAGWFFFFAGVLSAFSFPVATWLSARVGLVRTMVYTHVPSSIFLIGAAFSPNLELALFFLLLRSALSQMDVPARASYVMAIVSPPERAAAASLTSVPRSLAAAIGPAISGLLIATDHLIWPLLLCGALKISYDFGLLYMFRNVRPPEEIKY
ncbi:MAG: MFS transporter, partial [Pseudomonadota bacterium]|nr:MFS transporter [Pseudomonadota bacterium]